MKARNIFITPTFILLTAAAGGQTAEDFQELTAVNNHIYESFELLPIRGWADQFTAAPFWQIEATARKVDSPESLAAQFNAFVQKVTTRLHVPIIAEITFADDGTPTLKPGDNKVIFYKDVPDAIVFAVKPSPHSGKLTVAYADSPADTDQRKLLTDFIVIPVTLSSTGPQTLPVKLIANGKTVDAELYINVLPSGKLSGKITDPDNKPLVGKLFVESEDGRLFVIPGHPNYRTQNWYGYYQPRSSYVDGSFEMPLPPGKYHLTLSKGYSYNIAEQDIEIKADSPADVTLSLKTLRILAGGNWHCADMHTHAPVLSREPAERVNKLIRAEGLDFVTNTIYSTSRPAPMKVHEDVSDDCLLLFDQQEIEHWNFGNAFYVNAPHTATDPDPNNPEITPMFFYDKQIHEMGGTTMRWIRNAPFAPKGNGQQQPELAVDIPLGHLDLFQLLNNTQQEQLDRPDNKWTGSGWASTKVYDLTYKTYYAFLNCGLRVPISAGTSFGRLSRLGFNRVYVNIEKPFTLTKLADALKKGDGFVTNGPLLLLTANGKLPSDGLNLEKAGEIDLQVKMQSNWPVDIIELLENGEVVKTITPGSYKGGSVEFTHKANIEKPSWFAARCFGLNKPHYPHMAAHNQFAHTNPLFVTIAGKKPSSPEDARRFIAEIDALIDFAPNIPDSMRDETLSEFKKARKFYEEQTIAEKTD